MAKSQHVEKSGCYKWVPLNLMRVSPVAQRDFNRARATYLRANFNPDEMGIVTVNLRNGHYNIIDGQHRVAAVKEWLGDWEGQQIYCHVYDGLTESEEADKFDKLNNTLSVATFAKFMVRVVAGRQIETDVFRAVQACGLRVAKGRTSGSVSAVAALRRVYVNTDRETLERTLRIIRDSFGDSGFSSQMIEGIGMVCQRYNGTLTEERAISALSGIRAGISGLLGKAQQEQARHGGTKAYCVAAAAVDYINASKKAGGKKLRSFRRDSGDSDTATERTEP